MIRADSDRLIVRGPARLRGTVEAPGDKSLSHRALLCAAVARGESAIENLSPGDDVGATGTALRALGVSVHRGRVRSVGPEGFSEPEDVVDCGNSGTSLRLLTGLVAALPFTTVLSGDASLRSRPMLRVVAPLRDMGALIVGRRGGDRAPLAVRGGGLHGVRHRAQVASAQVKSALLFAGLLAEGPTEVAFPAPSRDHTERMLRALGVAVEWDDAGARVEPGLPRALGSYHVPGDISSAAFLLSAAALLPGSDVTVARVGVNPTRTGFLDALAAMGAEVEVSAPEDVLGEPVASVRVSAPERLHAVKLGAEQVPSLIDEIPVLAVLMAAARGRSEVTGADELRVKESDRIRTVADGLAAMSVPVETHHDGFAIEGPALLRPGAVAAAGDHRVAMAFAVAGLAARGETVVEGASSISTSYPGFVDDVSFLEERP